MMTILMQLDKEESEDHSHNIVISECYILLYQKQSQLKTYVSLDLALTCDSQSQVCLDLHHVDGLDREALGVLAASCPCLAKLGFSNCDFNSSASRQQVEKINLSKVKLNNFLIQILLRAFACFRFTKTCRFRCDNSMSCTYPSESVSQSQIFTLLVSHRDHRIVLAQ